MSLAHSLLRKACPGAALALCSPVPSALAAPPHQSATAPVPDAIKIGDGAPALTVGRWLKDSPILELKKGQVFVVEFWATWCGGCIHAMPHLTELARKYEGRVTFIGVNVWEKGHGNSHLSDADVDKKVDDFIAKKGPTMGYAVAQDTRDGTMARAWLEAAGVKGIPAAFLVDAEGRIALIDMPNTLDEAIPQLLAGLREFQKRPSILLSL